MSPRIPYHGNIRKRGPATYQIRLTVGGKRYAFTIKGTYAEAASFANTKHAELTAQLERQRKGLPGTMPFSALVQRFREDELPGKAAGTQRSYEDSLKPIEHYFVTELHDPDVASISRGQIRSFLSWRRAHRLDGAGRVQRAARRVTNRTIRKDRTVLHTLFEFAIDLELREDNPVRRVKVPKTPKRTPVLPTLEQYERLIEECRRSRQPMLALYVVTLGETGARSESEVLWLRWSDVHLDDGFIWIDSDPTSHETKGREGRWVPMSPRLQQALREHFARYRFATYGGRRPEFVFHHTTTKRRHRAGDRITSMRRAFKAAARRTGLPPRFGQHDLRHWRVTKWLAEGRNPVHVKEAVGHSDLRTTMEYTHLAREHLRALVDEQVPGTEGVRRGQS